MATAKQYTAKYLEFIGTSVIEKFCGSYQNYATTGKIWRQQVPYEPKIEDFILLKTRLFLNLLDIREQKNFDMIYALCKNIADHLSKYTVKKSETLTRKQAADEILNKIFLNNPVFVEKFKQCYKKKPINMSDALYTQNKPGVVAMYTAMNKQK